MWGADGNERSVSAGEDRESDDLPMTLARREASPGQREPVGYERSLVVKAVLAVVLVAIIVTLRALYLT
jgi:hypothetical protein